MTATDTDALTERIARLLCDNNGDDPDDMDLYRGDARTIMPLIAAEVRKAKAWVWDECAEMAAHHGAFDGSRARWLSSINPYRETGDSDEHR